MGAFLHSALFAIMWRDLSVSVSGEAEIYGSWPVGAWIRYGRFPFWLYRENRAVGGRQAAEGSSPKGSADPAFARGRLITISKERDMWRVSAIVFLWCVV